MSGLSAPRDFLSSQRVSNAKATVLIAEDNGAVRESTSEILETSGFSVLHAVNGDEALNMLRSNAVDVMLLDLWMPDRDGLSVLDAIRNDGHDVTGHRPAVIVVSAVAVDQATHARHNGSVHSYLRKPVAPEDLIEVLFRASCQSLTAAATGSRK